MVRKAAVFCIVRFYVVLGEDRVRPKFSLLNSSKIRYEITTTTNMNYVFQYECTFEYSYLFFSRLLNVYIEKALQSNS